MNMELVPDDRDIPSETSAKVSLRFNMRNFVKTPPVPDILDDMKVPESFLQKFLLKLHCDVTGALELIEEFVTFYNLLLKIGKP